MALSTKTHAEPTLLIGLWMIILICAELLARVSGGDLIQSSAWIAAGGVLWVARRSLGMREAYLLALCGGLTVLLLLQDDHPVQDVAVALDQATFMMVFILLMTTLLAFSISCDWALSMTFSPFATVVFLIDRVAGIRPITATWRWSFTHVCLSALMLVPAFVLLTQWM